MRTQTKLILSVIISCVTGCGTYKEEDPPPSVIPAAEPSPEPTPAPVASPTVKVCERLVVVESVSALDDVQEVAQQQVYERIAVYRRQAKSDGCTPQVEVHSITFDKSWCAGPDQYGQGIEYTCRVLLRPETKAHAAPPPPPPAPAAPPPAPKPKPKPTKAPSKKKAGGIECVPPFKPNPGGGCML